MVKKSFTNGSVRTQERRCNNCGHIGTCIILVCSGNHSPYLISRSIKKLEDALSETFRGDIQFTPVFDTDDVIGKKKP